MAVPQQEVRTVFALEGKDETSAAFKQVHTGLGQLGDQAGKAGGEFGKLGEGARGFGTETGKAHSIFEKFNSGHGGLPGLDGKHIIFRRLSNAVAGTGSALGEAVHGIGLVDAGMRLLPGPVGGAAAVMVGLGAAAYLVKKHFSELHAKMELLVGDANQQKAFDRWRDGMDMSVDGAIKLRNALDDVKERGLRPTDLMITQVRKNAERMGQDADEVGVAFVQAFAKGGDELRKFQNEHGQLGLDIRSLAEYARANGADTYGLGLSKLATDAETGQKALRDLQAEEMKLKELLDARNKAGEHIAETQPGSDANTAAYAANRKADQEFEAAQALYNQHKQDVDSYLAGLKQIQSVKDQLDALDAKADAETDKRKMSLAKIVADEAKLRVLAGERHGLEAMSVADIYAQADALRAIGKEEASVQKDLAEQHRKQAELDKAEKAERARKAKEAASEAKRHREEQLQHMRDLAKSRVELQRAIAAQGGDPDGRDDREKRALRSEAEAEIQGILRDTKKSIEERANLAEAARIKLNTKLAQIDKDAWQKSLDLERQAQDAKYALYAKRDDRELELARRQGDDEQVRLLERIQTDREFADAQLQIARELSDAKRQLTADDFKVFVRAEQLKLQAARDTHDAKLDDQEHAHAAAALDRVGQGLQGAFGALDRAGGKAATATSTLAKGALDVSKNWKSLGASAPDAIGAAGSVAAAFVDGEKSKAGVMAVTELGAGFASVGVGDIPGSVAHFTSAAIYGSIATGIVGTSGGAAGAGSVGRAGGASQQAGQGGASSSGAAVVNVYLGSAAVVGTSAQIGKFLAKNLDALNGTGFKKAA